MASTGTVVGASSGAAKEKSLRLDRKYKFWFNDQPGRKMFDPPFTLAKLVMTSGYGIRHPPANSGKWTVICDTAIVYTPDLVHMWTTSSMLAVVGDEADEALGVVLSVRGSDKHEVALVD